MLLQSPPFQPKLVILLLVGFSDAGLTAAFNFNTAITTDITLYAKWNSLGVLSQSITFASIPEQKYGNPDFDPAATTSSNLSVTYSSSDTTIAKIMASKIHIVGAGTCFIYADQAGDIDYSAAPQVSQTLIVTKKELSIEGVKALDKVYDRTTKASLTEGTLFGIVNSDDVRLVQGTGNFVDKNAGNDINISVEGFAITGNAAKNYIILAQPSGLKANITKANLTTEISVEPNISVYAGGTPAVLAIKFSSAISNEDGIPYINILGLDENIKPTLTTTDSITWDCPDYFANRRQ